MQKELYQIERSEVSLNISEGAVTEVRRKHIVRSGCRVYDGGKLGISGVFGEPDEATWQAAQRALTAGLSHPEPLGALVRSRETGVMPEERELLEQSEVVFACLNKNVILMHEEEFKALGNGKILFNTSIGPAFEAEDLKNWLDGGDNYFACDTAGAIGDPTGALLNHPRVFCVNYSAGRTKQAFGLLSEKVLDNIKEYMVDGTRPVSCGRDGQ